jgi:hypothetical protein
MNRTENTSALNLNKPVVLEHFVAAGYLYRYALRSSHEV